MLDVRRWIFKFGYHKTWPGSRFGPWWSSGSVALLGPDKPCYTKWQTPQSPRIFTFPQLRIQTRLTLYSLCSQLTQHVSVVCIVCVLKKRKIGLWSKPFYRNGTFMFEHTSNFNLFVFDASCIKGLGTLGKTTPAAAAVTLFRKELDDCEGEWGDDCWQQSIVVGHGFGMEIGSGNFFLIPQTCFIYIYCAYCIMLT